MRLVRSDSPEVVGSIAMTKALATRKGLLHFACLVNGLALLIALASVFALSPRTSLWVIGSVVLALNGYVLSRAITFRRQWEIAVSADRLYIRLFAWRSKDHAGAEVPDVLVLDASEIASMWARTVDVYLYGPKPKFVDWMLMIESAQGTFEDITKYIRPLLTQLEEKAVYVTSKEGRLTIEWEWWQPSLREFLQQVAEECPSTAIGPEDRSELDLNGIWHGNRDFPNAEQRRLLGQAIRLGFGCKLSELLGLRRRMPRRKAAALLSEIARRRRIRERTANSSAVSFLAVDYWLMAVGYWRHSILGENRRQHANLDAPARCPAKMIRAETPRIVGSAEAILPNFADQRHL